MSMFIDRVSNLKKKEKVHLESLDCDVVIKKLSWGEIKELRKWQEENNVTEEDYESLTDLVVYFLTNYFFDEDGNNLLTEDQKDIVNELSAESLSEIANAFNDINGDNNVVDEDDLKKK